MLFDFVYGMFSNDLAIDLGTANTLLYARGGHCLLRAFGGCSQGCAWRTQSVSGWPGSKEMLGRTPGAISAIRPMKDGVIADFDVTEAMIRHFITRAHQRSAWSSPV